MAEEGENRTAEAFNSERLVPLQVPIFVDRLTQRLWTPLNGVLPPHLVPQSSGRDSPHSISLGTTPTHLTDTKEENANDLEIQILHSSPGRKVCVLCSQLLGSKADSFSTGEQMRAHAQIHAAQCEMDLEVVLGRCFPREEGGTPAEALMHHLDSSKSILGAYEERLLELRGFLLCKSLACEKMGCQKVLFAGGQNSMIEKHLLTHLLEARPNLKLQEIQVERAKFEADLWKLAQECFPKKEVGGKTKRQRKQPQLERWMGKMLAHSQKRGFRPWTAKLFY